MNQGHTGTSCAQSIAELRQRKDLLRWKWDHLERAWIKPQVIVPGMTIMLRQSDGCYSGEMGWTGDKQHVPQRIEVPRAREESNDDDFFISSYWQTLQEHADSVVEELQTLLHEFSLPDAVREALSLAAIWHDAGKAHEVFQKALLGDPPEADTSQIWGKSARRGVRYERRGFRHELASALAMLKHGLPDLAAYLAAAHHGKVRLAIRSLPHETRPPDPERRHARGIWDQDELSGTMLTEALSLPPTTLDLSYMEFGDGRRGPSWLARVMSLRDDRSLGIFRLGFLEALLRIADWKASKRPVTKDA